MTPSDPPPGAIASAAAPGKLILLGEHAVVYGRPALAVPVHAVSVRATVWAGTGPLTIEAHFPESSGRPPLSVEVGEACDAGSVGDGGGVAGGAAPDPLATVVRAALARAGVADLPAWSIELRSTIPVGSGLGSSAAVAVALARAVGLAAGAEFDDRTASEVALEGERCTHGTPSGIDNAVVALGRPIRFAAGQARPATIGATLDLVVGDTGEVGLTGELVAGVRARRAAHRERYDRWLDQVGRLVDDAVRALAAGNLVTLGRLMNGNHLVLQGMRLSTPRLDTLVAAARSAGALGAKLSGAGGGGIMVALVTSEAAPRVERALVEAGAVRVIHTVIHPVIQPEIETVIGPAA